MDIKLNNMEQKDFIKATTLNLVNTIEYSNDSIVSKTLIKKTVGTVTLFAFDKEQGLSEHTAPFDAMVQVLDGKAVIKIDKNKHQVNSGEFIIMPAYIPHAVEAPEKFKMMLVMIKE